MSQISIGIGISEIYGAQVSTGVAVSNILLEDGFNLLLETGFVFLLE